MVVGSDATTRRRPVRPKHRPAGTRLVDRRATPPVRSLASLIAEYTAIFGPGWRPVTARKHRDDYARFLGWLRQEDRPGTVEALSFEVLLAYVSWLRSRPKVSGVWRGDPDALARAAARGSTGTLSANSVNTYVRPIRALCAYAHDEGIIGADPFRRTRRRARLNPLLPSELTPTKGATLADVRALEAGCNGEGPLDLRDRALVAILTTTAARNSSVRLLGVSDVDLDRGLIRFRRAKGGRTLEVALHPAARATVEAYLEKGRPSLLPQAAGPEPASLFLAAGRTGLPLSMNALSLMLTRRYHAGGGTLPYFGSHRLRHFTATVLANAGMGIDEIALLLGHSSTDTTRRYAQQSPESLGRLAAAALARAGVTG
jgi:integrase/recombinase XerD